MVAAPSVTERTEPSLWCIHGGVWLLWEWRVVGRRQSGSVSQNHVADGLWGGRGWRRGRVGSGWRGRRWRERERAAVGRRRGSRRLSRVDQVSEAGCLVNAGHAERGQPEQVDRGLGNAGVTTPAAVDARLDVAPEDQQRDAWAVGQLDVIGRVLQDGCLDVIVVSAPVVPCSA